MHVVASPGSCGALEAGDVSVGIHVSATQLCKRSPARKTWGMGERPEWPFWYAQVRAGLRAEAKFVADVWLPFPMFSIKPFKDIESYWTHHLAVYVEANNTFYAELVREGLDPSTYPRTLRGGLARDWYEGMDKAMREREKASYTERVGGTWAGNLRRACSSVLARRSRRVAPSARTAASEATGACLKREGTLGRSSGGAAGASVATKVLHEYTCPITAEIMTDPVSTLDGFTYERTAITEWLRTNDTSPSTGAKLESKRLIPNVTVRCLLQHL